MDCPRQCLRKHRETQLPNRLGPERSGPWRAFDEDTDKFRHVRRIGNLLVPKAGDTHPTVLVNR